jgi:hypothetical protein
VKMQPAGRAEHLSRHLLRTNALLSGTTQKLRGAVRIIGANKTRPTPGARTRAPTVDVTLVRGLHAVRANSAVLGYTRVCSDKVCQRRAGCAPSGGVHEDFLDAGAQGKGGTRHAQDTDTGTSTDKALTDNPSGRRTTCRRRHRAMQTSPFQRNNDAGRSPCRPPHITARLGAVPTRPRCFASKEWTKLLGHYTVPQGQR